MNRRALLESLAVGTGAVAAGAAVLPLAGELVAPLSHEAASADAPWIDVAGEKEVRAGAALKAVLKVPVRDGFFTTLQEQGAVFLRRLDDGTIAALSASCPHLGCGIVTGATGFVCPCHDSRFALDGNHLQGPSPRAMDPLPVRVANQRVLVQAVQFATGTRTRRQI